MPTKVSVVSGERYERLVTIRLLPELRNGRSQWECLCDCGTVLNVLAQNLKGGHSTSCGCFRKERIVEANTVHGFSTTPTGGSWADMLKRCYNPKAVNFHRYGASGIKVCEFLRTSPVNLVVLIGLRPEGKTIDRIIPTGSYTCGQCSECLADGWPLNVRWATDKEQARNRKTNRPVTIGGVTKLSVEWAEHLGIPPRVFGYRLRKYGNVEAKLTAPYIPKIKGTA